MRNLALVTLAIGIVEASGPARAQTYDPAYPVCLQVYGPANYNECGYSSLSQCEASASGRAAECLINPYFDKGYPQPVGGPHRRLRRIS